MKIVHSHDQISISVQRGRRIHVFTATPIDVLIGFEDEARWEPDYFNWQVRVPEEFHGKVIFNKGFRTSNEIEAYVKRFEDPGIKDVVQNDLRYS